MQLTGSQILMKVFEEQGVDTVFGYPGGAVLNIYDELYKQRDKVRHIITAHEQGATHAADGYARSSGKTGVAIVTSGPGSTNALTGIATAYMDSVPMVVISGNVATNLIGKDSFQEVYMEGLTIPITKHSYFVSDVTKLADTLRDAFRIAREGRMGPVSVDIAKDVTAISCEFTPLENVEKEETSYKPTDPELLQKIASLINESQRPVVYYGGGVVLSESSELLRELVHKMDSPACNSIMATGVLPHGDVHRMGMIGMHGNVSSGLAIKNCDLLLAVGARFSDRVATDVKNFAPNATIVHIDIDPSEIDKNVKVHQSVIGDVHQVLTQLLPLLEQKDRKEWLAQVEQWRAEKDPFLPEDGEVLTPHLVMKAIEEKLEKKDIITTDVGQHQMWACQFNKRENPRHFLTSGGLGTMGYGYGAAIGAKIANPNARVVHVTGDGSFHMNLNELCTSVSYQLPIVTVVMNNHVLGMVRQWQSSFYENRYSYTSPERKTDFVKLAEAFGGEGYQANNLHELREALAKAFEHPDRPTVINCEVNEDLYVLPMIPAGKSIDDVILKGKVD